MTICDHEPSYPGPVHRTAGHPTGRAPTVPRGQTGTKGTTLLVLLVATFMGQFDFFVVNVAAPSLRTDLHAGDVALELIVGGYAFTYAAGLITGGRLGDMFGHRRMYVIGMSSFTAASLLCGLASTPGQLIAFRLLQGLTAAAMLPQVLGLITATVPPRARPRAMAWYAVASGLGGIGGQVLGGLLVSADVAGLGWRAIFLVNVPVGVVGAERNRAGDGDEAGIPSRPGPGGRPPRRRRAPRRRVHLAVLPECSRSRTPLEGPPLRLVHAVSASLLAQWRAGLRTGRGVRSGPVGAGGRARRHRGRSRVAPRGRDGTCSSRPRRRRAATRRMDGRDAGTPRYPAPVRAVSRSG